MGVSKDEIKDLLVEIKSFYPRFALVDPDYMVYQQTLDAWYDMIGYKSHDECRKILQEHIAGPSGDKVPGISVFAGGRQKNGSYATAWIQNRQVCWKPEPDAEIQRFDVVWDGNAWKDTEGRLWAAPEGGENGH